MLELRSFFEIKDRLTPDDFKPFPVKDSKLNKKKESAL